MHLIEYRGLSGYLLPEGTVEEMKEAYRLDDVVIYKKDGVTRTCHVSHTRPTREEAVKHILYLVDARIAELQEIRRGLTSSEPLTG